MLQQRGLHQRDDDGGEGVAGDEEDPGGDGAVEVRVPDVGVRTEESSLIGLPLLVEQKTRESQDQDADHVHSHFAHHLNQSDCEPYVYNVMT